LSEGVKQTFEAYETECSDELYDKNTSVDHGRIEERVCLVLKADRLPKWVPREDWAGLNTIIQIQSERTIMANGTVTQDTRYYISSLLLSADRIAAYVRGYWGTENQLHYTLDMFWGEDGSRKRIGCAADNFGTVLRIAHNLIKTHLENISIKRKRKKADRSDLYREQILRLQT